MYAAINQYTQDGSGSWVQSRKLLSLRSCRDRLVLSTARHCRLLISFGIWRWWFDWILDASLSGYFLPPSWVWTCPSILLPAILRRVLSAAVIILPSFCHRTWEMGGYKNRDFDPAEFSLDLCQPRAIGCGSHMPLHNSCSFLHANRRGQFVCLDFC